MYYTASIPALPLIAFSFSRFRRFAELIESTFTNIFLVSVCLNMIGGSMIGIQVCELFFILHFAIKFSAKGNSTAEGESMLNENNSYFVKIFQESIRNFRNLLNILAFQVVLNLNDAKDIVEPFAIYIAQLIHLFLQFWPAQFLIDYSILPYESM